MKLKDKHFIDLVETRILLEIQATRTAAKRRTEGDIIRMQNALNAFQARVVRGFSAVEEDLLFHLTIADAGQNSVLKSILRIITPHILTHYKKLVERSGSRCYRSLEEHEVILEHIINQESELAAKAMKEHLEFVTKDSQIKESLPQSTTWELAMQISKSPLN